MWFSIRTAATLGDRFLALPADVYLRTVDRIRVQKAARMPGYPRSDDRSLDAAFLRHEMESAALGDVPGESIARFLYCSPLYRALQESRFAYQRVVRGWDDRSLWSLDYHVAKTLSAQLDALADQAHGWPESSEYPEYDDWTQALRAAANKLRFYAEHATDELDGEALESGREAMSWVADNFSRLWD